MKSFFLYLFIIGFCFQNVYSQGNVYLVLGSDTGIWDGLNTNSFHNIYGTELYSDPNENAYKVMSDQFRNQIKDSYDNTLKMTWWMMGGNTYRYGINTNVPEDNILPLYLMKKYHNDKIKKWGDEVSLHYHTFKWYDYDGDGVYFWNQAQNFEDSKEDFDYTLAQFLLEENVFPVSFRSGWHYMDNYWQIYLDSLLLFSMHDDYPAKHVDIDEPLDNNYDWSQSSSEFIPFHPSSENYQLQGDLKGWELRSKYMAYMDTTLLNYIFNQAKNGIDQVVCLWAHLPEDDFPDNIVRINNIVHSVAAKYPDVKFRYCTAIEAMQRWLKTSDTTKPDLKLSEQLNGNEVRFLIQTDEKIFQPQPFIAVKDIYENYSIEQCDKISEYTWITSKSFTRNKLAKVGVAVTDTVGNLSTAFINILPDDIFIDNNDANYSELRGNWISKQNRFVWNLNYRETNFDYNDSVMASWTLPINHSGNYNIFIQFPSSEKQTNKIKFKIKSGSNIKEVNYSNDFSNGWNYISTDYFDSNANNSFEMTAYGIDSAGNSITTDVLKLSALIRDKQLYVPQEIIEFGLTSEEDTAKCNFVIKNLGIDALKITNIKSNKNEVFFNHTFPIIIQGMKSDTLELKFNSEISGEYRDTIFVFSDDPNNPVYSLEYTAQVEPYFKIIDNEDSAFYQESGQWHYSSAFGYGGTSRYAFLNQNPPAFSIFSAELKKSGVYDIEQIIPTTVNAAKQALYILSIGGVDVDSFFVDQNIGSGEWNTINRSFIPANVNVKMKIVDSGESTANVVLRADAIKFSMVKEITDVKDNNELGQPVSFKLDQNYPNPFNPSTTIRYSLPKSENVLLEVFDILGRRLKTLIDQFQKTGYHEIIFEGNDLSNGIYFYRITTETFSATKKMILLK